MKPQKNRFVAHLRNTAAVLCLALVCHAPASYAEQADRNKPVHLEADQLSIDDARQISTFEGNVQLSQGTMMIRGDKVIVTQDKDGVRHGTAIGQPASFRQKREGSDDYIEGIAERIEYDAQNETVDLFGAARMKRNQDEVRGDHISYSAKTEIFQASSAQGKREGTSSKDRVRVVIQPKEVNATDKPATSPLPLRPEDTLAP
ncbi:Lipopolysaccharide export system protein LptA [Gallionellaceae bacterium]|nr:Lipopolysaccharide export system protein LptA [Gallionellaceae bacterium]